MKSSILLLFILTPRHLFYSRGHFAQIRWRFLNKPSLLSLRFLFTPSGLPNGRPSSCASISQSTENGEPLILYDSEPPSRRWSENKSCLLVTSKHTLFLKFPSLARNERSRIEPGSVRPLRRNFANDLVNLFNNVSNTDVLA